MLAVAVTLMTSIRKNPCSNLFLVLLRSSGHVTEYYIKLDHDCFHQHPFRVLSAVTQLFIAVLGVCGNTVSMQGFECWLYFIVEMYLQSFIILGD
jgi:hypothetical protein